MDDTNRMIKRDYEIISEKSYSDQVRSKTAA